ncbi:sulfatase [Niabella insulamsoli]|uniref:sulfatase n=1 Tax=Niabella insulamsoli TaxID=3144874 RepID=UPI003CCC82DC
MLLKKMLIRFIVCWACVACWPVWLNAAGADRSPKYNVLFIMADDLRPDLGCYGNSKVITPHMDRLAAASIVFNRAYCQQAVCNPSRASMLTGLRPDETGVTDLVTHFRDKVPDAVTLPQAFKNSGYTTVGLGKIFHGTKATEDTVSWSSPKTQNLATRGQDYHLSVNKTGRKAAAMEFIEGPDSGYPDGKISDEAIRLLRQYKSSGEPFFLATGFKKPHLPFCAPKKYWDKYADISVDDYAKIPRPKAAPDIAFHQWQELRGYTDIPKEAALSPQQRADLVRGYYACISFVDAQIGKVLSELKQLGLDKNTIVVLVGDHGYHLGEQELWCKSTNFELDARIPLLIAVPGFSKTAGHSDAIVEAVDIYPTLTALCGIDAHTPLSGKSLVPLISNPKKKWNGVAFSQFCRPYKAITAQKPTHMGYTMRDADFRYTLWYNLNTDSIEARELYQLSNDGVETENLTGNKKYQAVESRMQAVLEAYRKR